VPLLRDAMTAGSIGREGHGRDLRSEVKRASTLSSPGYQLAQPCNKAIARVMGRFYALAYASSITLTLT
jgi:hypothetical protein